MDKKYLTIENSFKIYDRLKNEVNIVPGCTPYLWGNILVGDNDIILTEKDGLFSVYIQNIKEFSNIEIFSEIKDAVDYLISYYENNMLVDDSNIMRNIFYETYGIERDIERVLEKRKRILRKNIKTNKNQ